MQLVRCHTHILSFDLTKAGAAELFEKVTQQGCAEGSALAKRRTVTRENSFSLSGKRSHSSAVVFRCFSDSNDSLRLHGTLSSRGQGSLLRCVQGHPREGSRATTLRNSNLRRDLSALNAMHKPGPV
jgi:hypothetical protein